MSKYSQSTRLVGRLLWEELLEEVIVHISPYVLLRNEFNFWNVHGIMNTSGLLQSRLHVNFARDRKYS